jgi:Ca2+-binding EF-hand superfamily protein
MALLSSGTLDERAELIFNLYDFNSDNFLSKDELAILVTNCQTAINNMTGKPKPDINAIDKLTAQYFEALDTNHDH